MGYIRAGPVGGERRHGLAMPKKGRPYLSVNGC